MRFLKLSLIVALALAFTACSSKTSSNSSQTSGDQTTTESSAAASEAPSTEASAAPSTATGQVPAYPGATTQYSGSSSSMGQSAGGTVMTTDDSFDKVYSWYQAHMPAGSEKAHVTAPVQSAVFTIGEMGSDQTSVSITVSGGKTMITIGHVKR